MDRLVHLMFKAKNKEQQRMTDIMHISPEVLEMIFVHLDTTSLKSCLNVSKYFRDVILNSPSLMKKLPLKLNSENWKLKLELLQPIGTKIKSVDIFSNSESCEFLKLLHFTPMASNVVIRWDSMNQLVDYMHYAVLTQRMEIKLEKLEILKTKFYKVNPEIFFHQMLNSRNVKKISISCTDTSDESTSIVALLTQQSKLEEFELKFGLLDNIFAEETIGKFNFKLRKFTIATSKPLANNYIYLNKFLLMQSQNLMDLCVFGPCAKNIASSICRLENLTHLTTHTLLPRFRVGNFTVMKSLTHYRYYGGNTNESIQRINAAAFPNLQSLNIHFGIDHRLYGAYPDEKTVINPLKNLQRLREFHIESRNQDVLHYLASPELEILAISEDELVDDNNWIKIRTNLPKLNTLIVENLSEEFLKFFCDNFKRFIQTINLKLLILRDHFYNKNVMKFIIENGKILKVRGYYCNMSSRFITKEVKLKRKFGDFKLIFIDDDEYEKKYEFWNCYFHLCGP